MSCMPISFVRTTMSGATVNASPRLTVVGALAEKLRIPSRATTIKATTCVGDSWPLRPSPGTTKKRGTPKGPPLLCFGSAIFGWSFGLIGAHRAVQEPELVGPGDQVVLGVLASFGVGPLVEGQAGGGFEESALGAVAGDELGRLLPRLEVDEDRLVPSLLVDGHPHGGDGLALSRSDLELGIGGETAGDRYGVHVVSSLVG